MSAAVPARYRQAEAGVIAQDWNARELAALAQWGSDPNSGHGPRAGHWSITDLAKPQVQGSDPDCAGRDISLAGHEFATQFIAIKEYSSKASGRFAFKNRSNTESFKQKQPLTPEFATKSRAINKDSSKATGRLDTKCGSDPVWAGRGSATQFIAAREDANWASGLFAFKSGQKTASFRQNRPLTPEFATKNRAINKDSSKATGRFDPTIASRKPFSPALVVLDVKDAA